MWLKMGNETKTENKQNWVKQHLALCIIIAVIIVVVVGVTIYIFSGSNPEEVAKKYVEAMSEGSTDKLMEITDLKGAYAWEKCDGDVDKFLEEYKNVSDEEVASQKEEMRKSLDTAMAMLKTFGGVQISLKNIENTENLGKGISKVKVNIQMEMQGNTQEQDVTIVVYQGKLITQI